MNKQFSNRILVCPAANIPQNIVHPYTGFTELHSNVEVVPNFQIKQNSGNNSYEFSLRATLSLLSSEQNTLMKNNRPLCLVLFDESGNHYKIGTELIPIQAELNTFQFNCEVKFSGKFLNVPY